MTEQEKLDQARMRKTRDRFAGLTPRMYTTFCQAHGRNMWNANYRECPICDDCEDNATYWQARVILNTQAKIAEVCATVEKFITANPECREMFEAQLGVTLGRAREMAAEDRRHLLSTKRQCEAAMSNEGISNPQPVRIVDGLTHNYNCK
jgi:hypothetical protein